jgi:L-fuculose-phosphate aldolase
MANHGVIALGETLAAALELAFEVETLAEQYYKVLTLDAPHVLPDDEMARILEKFASYGQRGQG